MVIHCVSCTVPIDFCHYAFCKLVSPLCSLSLIFVALFFVCVSVPFRSVPHPLSLCCITMHLHSMLVKKPIEKFPFTSTILPDMRILTLSERKT